MEQVCVITPRSRPSNTTLVIYKIFIREYKNMPLLLYIIFVSVNVENRCNHQIREQAVGLQEKPNIWSSCL